MYLIASIIEITFFTSWATIITSSDNNAITIKHILITLPISIALCLQFYLMIPIALIRRFQENNLTILMTILISAISMGFGLFIETGFRNAEVFLTMVLIGFFLGAGSVLTGKFFLTFTTLFLIIYTNSLAMVRYIDFSFPVAITGFIFCISALLIGFAIQIKYSGTEHLL